MKKWFTIAVVGLVLATSVPSARAVNTARGGFMGFIAGCCFGIRAGSAYNEGKEIHWREWVMLVPVVGLVVSVWNGMDAANGMTSSDYAAKYGSVYY